MAIDDVGCLRRVGTMAPPIAGIWIQYRASRRHQRPNCGCILQRFDSQNWQNNIGWRDKTKLDNKIAVLNMDPKSARTVYSVEIEQKQKEAKEYSTARGKFVSLLSEVYALAEKTEESKLDTPDLYEFIIAQTTDSGWYLEGETVKQPKTLTSYDADVVVVTALPVDAVWQRYEPAVLRPRVLLLCHYSLMEGHPGRRMLYGSMRGEFFWLYMANDVYVTVHDFQSCTRNSCTGKSQLKLRLLSPTGSLEFVAINILGPLTKTKTGNQFFAIMKVRFWKLTKANPRTKRQQTQSWLSSSMTVWKSSKYRPRSWPMTVRTSRQNSFRRFANSWRWSR